MGFCRYSCDVDKGRFSCCLECNDRENCTHLMCDHMDSVEFAEDCENYSCIQDDKKNEVIDSLNAFTKAWCQRDMSGDEPVFNCEGCDFREGSICMIKRFANKIDRQYCRDIGFGSMSR